LINTPIITIVDDDDVVRISMDSLVRSMGYVSHSYSCAEDFLASRSLDVTSCLISDIRMPGLSGLQLLEEMLARSIRYPVIFVTACIGDLPELKARELGAVGYFKKPFNGAQLMSHIRGVLDAEQILEA